ncbi:MAG: hypothetical protein O9327_02265 [Polaromonas sp.]|nr:hypothetical protein [Polaromonas sp.]
MTTRQLTVPLVDLLYQCPTGAVPFVQDAIRAVGAGDWSAAARQMGLAAEASDTRDAWFDKASRCADELQTFTRPQQSA